MKKVLIGIVIVIFLLPNDKFSKNNSTSFQEGVIYLSQYIASDEFIELSEDYSDQYLVDHLYKYALAFYNGNISEALLALTFATLPFNKMPITIPIINVRIPLKLPAVNEKLFQIKRKNLPGIIYFDSPKTGGQDKDKVAHFFGNAFIAYNISFMNASKILGILVELFESSFKVSGGVDFRDLQTNGLGEYFGNSLINNDELLPSKVFNIYSLFYFSFSNF
ncbi:MAG: hypothetical protein GY936_12860 [Ignavibacteriae bacterium]|nr:hypothetical protein [Ignavibacteriota bacterium]